MVLMPVSILAYLYLSGFRLDSELLIFCFIYVFSSRFFSPDLDIMDNRPGKAHFPLGALPIEILMKASKISKRSFLLPVYLLIETILKTQRILARLWYLYWQLPSYLVTHRGIYHWPIIGVLVRIFILGIGLHFINAFLSIALNRELLSKDCFKELFLMFLDYKDPSFIYLCLPVYLSDIAHSLVDAKDSFYNGTRFCPRGIPRGLIAKILRF